MRRLLACLLVMLAGCGVVRAEVPLYQESRCYFYLSPERQPAPYRPTVTVRGECGAMHSALSADGSERSI